MDARAMVVMFQNFSLHDLFLKPETLKAIASTQETRTIESSVTNIFHKSARKWDILPCDLGCCWLWPQDVQALSDRDSHSLGLVWPPDCLIYR